MFSLAVLIGRGLDQVLHEFFFCFSLFSFQGIDTLYIDFLRNKEVFFCFRAGNYRRHPWLFRLSQAYGICFAFMQVAGFRFQDRFKTTISYSKKAANPINRIESCLFFV